MFIRSRHGITLIELVVVIAVIGILCTLMMPGIQSSRSTSRRLKCVNQMRQVTTSVFTYTEANRRFPAFGYEETSWTCVIMPYLDDGNLNKRMNVRVGRDNSVAVAESFPIFQCPEHPDKSGQSHSTIYAGFGTRGLTSYLGVAGRRYKERYTAAGDTGILGAYVNDNTGVTTNMIRDGVSNTFLLGERPPGPGRTGDWGWWAGRNDWDIIMYPYVLNTDAPPSRISAYRNCVYPATYRKGKIDNPCDQDHFWSLHGDGANWVMADGSVHFINYAVSSEVMDQMSTRDQGELFDIPWER